MSIRTAIIYFYTIADTGVDERKIQLACYLFWYKVFHMIEDSEKFNQGHTHIINMRILIQIFVDD